MVLGLLGLWGGFVGGAALLVHDYDPTLVGNFVPTKFTHNVAHLFKDRPLLAYTGAASLALGLLWAYSENNTAAQYVEDGAAASSSASAASASSKTAKKKEKSLVTKGSVFAVAVAVAAAAGVAEHFLRKKK